MSAVIPSFIPLLAGAHLLRLALFLPFATMFFLPMLFMRPKLILKTPRMIGYMLLARRRSRVHCRFDGPGGRWQQSRLELAEEPIRL